MVFDVGPRCCANWECSGRSAASQSDCDALVGEDFARTVRGKSQTSPGPARLTCALSSPAPRNAVSGTDITAPALVSAVSEKGVEITNGRAADVRDMERRLHPTGTWGRRARVADRLRAATGWAVPPVFQHQARTTQSHLSKPTPTTPPREWCSTQ